MKIKYHSLAHTRSFYGEQVAGHGANRPSRDNGSTKGVCSAACERFAASSVNFFFAEMKRQFAVRKMFESLRDISKMARELSKKAISGGIRKYTFA